MWPYNIARFAVKPSAAAYRDGLDHKIKSYHRLDTLTDMKTCLASGFPFVFGFAVYDSFESSAVAKTGVVPMPSAGEGYLGGHAVCAVGYSDATQRLLVRNSWGSDWGMSGYFTMPYDYVSNRSLSDDFWTIQS
jgi:C1A family cysteine protease